MKKEMKARYDEKMKVVTVEIKNCKSCKAALASLPEFWRQIDVRVNNAGMASDLVKLQNGDLMNWDVPIDTNIKGLMYVSRIVSGMMIEQGGGNIVNIGSVAGTEPYEAGNIYVATKHAVHGLSKAMRIDLLGTGVKVTEIRPGKVNTEFSLVRFHGDRAAADRAYEGYMPLSGDDVAAAVVWSVSQPAHVNIDEVVLTPAAQANSYFQKKEGK